MEYKVTQKEKNTVEIRFEVSVEDTKPFLEQAAKKLSETTTIPGFRPGHATYTEVEKRVGAMKILEEALESIARKFYVEAVMTEKLEPVGSPSFDVEKLAPGNPIIFKMTVSLLPTITKLIDYKTLKVKHQPIEIKDEEVGAVLSDIQKMQTKEVRATRPVEGTDHVVVELEISKDGKPIEGGTAKNHHLIMSEPYYILGFTDQLKGMKEGEEKSFTLPFPEEHYKKDLADKPVDLKVKISEVYERQSPPLDDELAKMIGKTTLAELRELVKENLKIEKEGKEDQRLEREMLDKIVEGSQFEDVPDLLVNEEVERMRHELEHNVAKQGMEWGQYLQHLGKTEAQLKLEFAPQAVRRIKTMLVIREIAKQEDIKVTEEEIDKELDRVADCYKDDKETREQLYSPQYRDQFTIILKNQKTITRLKEIMVQ